MIVVMIKEEEMVKIVRIKMDMIGMKVKVEEEMKVEMKKKEVKREVKFM